MKHLLSIEELAWADMDTILADTVSLKKERGRHARLPLAGQTWAMLFSKSSTPLTRSLQKTTLPVCEVKSGIVFAGTMSPLKRRISGMIARKCEEDL